MGCQSCSSTYLNILNGLILLASLIIIAYSAYLAAELKDFDQIVQEGAIISPLVFAAALLIVSVVGVIAVRNKNKCLLFIYLIFASGVTVVLIACGAVLLSFSGLLVDIENDTVQNASGSLEARVLDFELAVFQVCCVDQGFATNAPVPCSDVVTSGCFHDQARFDDFVSGIPQDLCDALEDVSIGGADVVGDSSTGACGNGDAGTFTDRLSTFLSDNIKPLGATNIALAAIMLIDLVATCVLLWSKKEEYYPKAKQYQNQAAPEVAGDSAKY